MLANFDHNLQCKWHLFLFFFHLSTFSQTLQWIDFLLVMLPLQHSTVLNVCCPFSCWSSLTTQQLLSPQLVHATCDHVVFPPKRKLIIVTKSSLQCFLNSSHTKCTPRMAIDYSNLSEQVFSSLDQCALWGLAFRTNSVVVAMHFLFGNLRRNDKGSYSS